MKTNKNSSKQKTLFDRGEKVLFVIIFSFSFALVSFLTVSFPDFSSAISGSIKTVRGVLFVQNDYEPVTNELHGAPTKIFSDVDSNHPNAMAIAYLKSVGVIGGYPDGSFKPDVILNRAELLKFVVTTLGAAPFGLSNSFCFKDVKDEWFAPFVCFAKNKGWVEGFADGTFRASDNVTKVQALKMVMAGFGAKLNDSAPLKTFADFSAQDWFAKYVWTAQENGWLEQTPEQGSYNGNDGMTRAHAAELLYRVSLSLQPTI